MKSYQYNNPYHQPAKFSQIETPEQLLEHLNARTTLSSHRAELLKLYEENTTSFHWSQSSAFKLVEWAFPILRTKDESTAVVLLFLQKCLSLWADRLVYATALHTDFEAGTLLDLLGSISLELLVKENVDASVPRAALSTLVTVWEAFERLHSVCSILPNNESTKNDVVWWIPNIQSNQIWERLAILLFKEFPGTIVDKQLRPEEWKATCASFLTQLLNHQQVDWIYACTEESLDKMQNELVKESSRLTDMNMPVSSFTRLSMVSVQLWISISQARGVLDVNDQHTFGLLRGVLIPVTQAVFSGLHVESVSQQPRWVQSVHTSSYPVWKWAQNTLSILCGMELEDTVRESIQHCAVEGWRQLLDNKDSDRMDGNADMELFLLVKHFGGISRECLKRVLATRSTSAVDLAHIALTRLQEKDSVWTIGILRILLGDRASMSTHDELSRQLWSEIKDSFAFDAMKMLKKGGSTRSLTHALAFPTYLCLLDSLFTILSQTPLLLQNAVSSLSAEVVEAIISLCCPTKQRGGLSSRIDTEVDEDTPTANNLSRISDHNESFEAETSLPPRGMDLSLRLAAAAVIALIGTAQPDPGASGPRTSFLQSRLCEPLTNFHFDIDQMTRANNEILSTENTIRRLRFTAAFSNVTTEAQLSLALCEQERSRSRTLSSLEQKIRYTENELKEGRAREQQLRNYKNRLYKQLQEENTKFSRARNSTESKWKRKMENQILVHVQEREKAESLVSDAEKRLQEARNQVVEAEQALQSCRQENENVKTQLEVCTEKLNSTENRYRTVCEKIQRCEKDYEKTTNEVDMLRSKLSQASSYIEGLRKENNGQKHELVVVTESETEMRRSLEHLFSDMVSLAQIYEGTEREMRSLKSDGNATSEDLRRQLREEKRRVREMKEKIDQVQYENEVLSQKNSKLRERIDQERQNRQRQHEHGRLRGSTSYLNQLNISSASEVSSKSMRRFDGKENASSRSSRQSSRKSGSYR